MNEQNNNTNEQFNQTSGMPNPGMPNPGMPNPEMPNPGMPNPGMPNPGMPNPGMPNPEMPNPGMPNPGMPNPEMPNPGMPNPGMPNPGMPNPGMPNPGMPNPGMPNPGMPNPGMPNPGMPNPGMPNPEMPNPGMPNPGMMNYAMPPQKKSNKNIIFIIIGVVAALIIGLLLYFLVFSGNKTLVCTNSQNAEGIMVSTNYDFKFKHNKVDTATVKMTFDLAEYASYKDEFLKEIEQEFLSDDYEGVNVEITSDDSKIYVNMNASKDSFAEAGLTEGSTYNEIKADLESEGAVCK